MTGFPSQPDDYYRFYAAQETGLKFEGLGSHYVIDFVILFEDPTGLAVSTSGPLESDPPAVSDYASKRFFLSFCAGLCSTTGDIVAVHPVPEPSTVVLLGWALSGFGERKV